MTSSETKNLGGIPSRIHKGNRVEHVMRKPSFKCPAPNKQPNNQRITRKVMLPVSTVQALTCKFNELSQMGQSQIRTVGKAKKGQALVKSKIGVCGKSSTITVVICRKGSSLKSKRPRGSASLDDEKDGNSFDDTEFGSGKVNKIQRNVLERVTKFEKRKSNFKTIETFHKSEPENDMIRTSKISVPKVIVDIDLSEGKCPKNLGDATNPAESKPNGWSVKTAIDKYERNLEIMKSPLQQDNRNKYEKAGTDSKGANESKICQFGNENFTEVKPKPIATIKPILKKTEDRIYPISMLSPKDSLYRKKYLGMKRDQTKTYKESEQEAAAEKETPTLDITKVREVNVPPEEHAETDSGGHCREAECAVELQNKSSLFGHLSHSQSKDISTTENHSAHLHKNEDVPTDTGDIPPEESKNENTIIKPNASFLWFKKQDHNFDVQQEKPCRTDLPLPLPPENYIPDIAETSPNCFREIIYDDVQPKNHDEFDKSSNHSDETVYDDIGVYSKRSEGYEKINRGRDSKRNNADGDEADADEVRKKNFLNNMVNRNIGASDSLYCISESLRYGFDDRESDRYHYARLKNETNPENYGNESYQYIRNQSDENNIYEDIQSVKNRIFSKENNKDVYDDVQSNGNENGTNCYESVYNERYLNADGSQSYIRSNASDISSNSCRSAYEKSNSLYGMTTRNCTSKDHRSGSSEASEADDPDVYCASSFGTDRPSSESSHSNSDEWVEVSDSESERTVYLVRERPKKTKSGASGWAQKERRRWLKLKKKVDSSLDESRNSNSEDHFYESIGQHESADDSIEYKGTCSAAEQFSQLNGQQIYSEDLCIDDFDSQSSDDEINIDAKLPETPTNGYNITKSLKAAGQKLRKNFSLRTSDFSKSLKRFKRQTRPKLSDKIFTKDEDKELAWTSHNGLPQQSSRILSNLNNADSPTSSSSSVKRNSSNDFKNSSHRKTWTFRNKFKKGQSTDVVPERDNSDARNSVFYLSLNEVRGQRPEKKDEFLTEIQNLISRRNSSSLENVSDRKQSLGRLSQASEGRANAGKTRPSIPPPPPPNIVKSDNVLDGTKYSDIILRKDRGINNSLYVESGLFDKQQKRSRCISDSSKSWYAEVGLYAANENSSQDKKSQMLFDEPLYQFYTECVNQQARDDIMKNYDSEGYEEINDYYSIINEKRRTLDIKNVRPNFEDFSDDIPPKSISFRPHNRTLWCQIPVVIDSCILQSLPDQVKKLQEAKFEILTSEESYMNSLNVLENHFMKKIGESNLITKRDFKILFSNILPVKKCSEDFLNDLEYCWQNNIMLNGICDIVHVHSTENFSVYVKYCKNQISIYRTLRELIDKNSNFEAVLKDIESDPICQNLSIHSFLMLPMQRITRLPLLLGAVLARLDKSDDEYQVCKSSFETLNKIVQECDEEARRMEKCEEMLILSQQIEFPREIRGIPIITGQRFLVKTGQVTQLVNREENKLTFGKKFSKVNLTLFLFTDLLIVTKKKGMRNYVVIDHCPRNLVQMQTTEGLTQIPVKLGSSSDSGGKLLMLLTMLENHEKKTVEMVLSFEMESDRQRWLEAVTPKLSENPDESIYEEWDCPQVIALYEFTSTQPDELSLCIGDVVNVLKKMNDGWYQGERLRDGAKGWFPQNHTQEILSTHVRAKNKKLRYKILSQAGNFIESQMKNGKQ